MTEPGSQRRHFIRDLLRGAARVTSDGRAAMTAARRSAIGGMLDPGPPGVGPTAGDRGAAPAPPAPLLPPPKTLVSPDGLREIVRSTALVDRAEEVIGLARPSVRLTFDESGSSRSQFGGLPLSLGGNPWPTDDDRALPLLLQVSLGDLPDGALPAGVPGTGILLLFAAAAGDAEPYQPADPAAVSVLVVDDADPGQSPAQASASVDAAPLRRIPLRMAAELALPRAWSDTVERLGLDVPEQEAWETVRERLALAQGTIPWDRVPASAEISRLFGYPDDRSGDMPLICERRSQGLPDPVGAELHEQVQGWGLLAQLDVGRLLGVDDWRRLYVWSKSSALGRITQAIVR